MTGLDRTKVELASAYYAAHPDDIVAGAPRFSAPTISSVARNEQGRMPSFPHAARP